ncbi:extensin-like [Neopelma chrysocephalum]|uniref:extensin-like n=1 Tax=Neopelma chrysocephalum TaxID=114329 RepID=UPI000FCD2144|nr:extensin-like [Neopelma chrysocephalum]
MQLLSSLCSPKDRKQAQLPGYKRLKFLGILILFGSPGAAPVSSWLREHVWAPSPLLPRSHINLECSHPSPFGIQHRLPVPSTAGADLHLCHSFAFLEPPLHLRRPTSRPPPANFSEPPNTPQLHNPQETQHLTVTKKPRSPWSAQQHWQLPEEQLRVHLTHGITCFCLSSCQHSCDEGRDQDPQPCSPCGHQDEDPPPSCPHGHHDEDPPPHFSPRPSYHGPAHPCVKGPSSISNPKTSHSRRISGRGGMVEPTPLPGAPRRAGQPCPPPARAPACSGLAGSGTMEQASPPALRGRFPENKDRGGNDITPGPNYFSRRRTAKIPPFPSLPSSSPSQRLPTGDPPAAAASQSPSPAAPAPRVAGRPDPGDPFQRDSNLSEDVARLGEAVQGGVGAQVIGAL